MTYFVESMRYLVFYLFVFHFSAISQSIPKPTKAQLAWHDQEFYLFTHFGPNTFTDLEWGHGDENAEIFNPALLDCRQWARIAKAAGAKGIIITAKHHDGFCLWPSQYSTHTVRESKWKEGKGDVVKELSLACKEYGLKFGVYISPWDRNHPKYGTDEYNNVFVNMMRELFTQYGPIWELWWDGANGEGPNGKKQVYNWDLFKRTVKSLSPNTVVFSDVGPQIRWVGNERGIASETNWNTLNIEGFTPGHGAPPQDTLGTGNIHGKNWIPAECDVSIRPGWFYHKAEDEKVKSPETLFDLYLKSVGRGANFLLNVPPDGRGLIHKNDSTALVDFYKLKKNYFSIDLAKNRKLIKTGKNKFRMIWPSPISIHALALTENIMNGQSISFFKINLYLENELVNTLEGSTVGHKRILTFPNIRVDKLEIVILDIYGRENIKKVEVY